MNRLTNCFAFVTLFATAAAAQGIGYPDGSAGPTLTAMHKGGDLTVTCGPRADFPGVLILLGSFDGQMAKLGKDLPPVLVHSSVIAMAFAPGETISISAKWPPMHVRLQAVEVSFKPFGVAASEMLLVGDQPISDAMVDAARKARGDVCPPGSLYPGNVDADGNLLR
jgi:hypothetical protein